MTFELRGNPNYAAMIHEYDPANEVVLPNRDRVVGYKVLGYQSIVQKGAYQAGELVVVFGAGTQVSEDYAWYNDLYRHEHLNGRPGAKGYLEDNRRVKAIKFGGHRSDALVMPLASLAWFAPKGGLPELVENAKPGLAFDHVNGEEISRKYLLPVKRDGRSLATKQGQKRVRVTTEMFPEHFDTPNGFRVGDTLFQPGDHVVVTQKLHGTSVRLGRVPVLRDLKWYERLAQRLGVKVQTHEHGVVVGSRRVTKSINGEAEAGKQHFYADDLWTEVTRPMHALIPEGFLVFAEIVGWTPDGAPIQKDYTYDVPRGEAHVYVYRVATINGEGDVVDLPWRAVERFCEARGWKHVPVLTSGYWHDSRPEIDVLMDERYADMGLPAIPLSDPKLPDEGVVVRADTGFTPTVAKYKSPAFLRHEDVVLDQGEADVESVEDVEVAA
ncbi:RNA ligase family protein [Puerhibacterium puerhi]|uniref:RNA ligase family protein n=1 Tax=Puerhibacterium puerhi TaxID=2692623 RepID=UPI00135C2B9F|nr:RNA ligase family protein [Puerhibacterium puerhi]